MKKNRAPDLSDQTIASIVDILDGWTEKLTWDLLIAEVAERLGPDYTYSRFTLIEHPRIKTAFDLRKTAVRGLPAGPRIPRDERLSAAFEQIERLKARLARVEVENDRLLEQFHTWAINAEKAGVSMDKLNRPLAKPQREQSRIKGA